MNTIEIPAMDVLVGDRITYNHKVWTVMFATLVRGTIIEITVKEVGLLARSAPEQKLIVHKNAPVTKVI